MIIVSHSLTKLKIICLALRVLSTVLTDIRLVFSWWGITVCGIHVPAERSGVKHIQYGCYGCYQCKPL